MLTHQVDKEDYCKHQEKFHFFDVLYSLPVRRTRGPCGVGFGEILASVFSATLSSCAVHCKEEADVGCYIFYFSLRLFKVIVVLLDLVNCMHYYF